MKIVSHFIAIVVVLGVSPYILADDQLKTVDLNGVWNVKASTDNGVRKITWTIKQKGDELTGESLDQESSNERSFDRITVKEKKVTLEVDVEQDGNQGVIRVEAEEKTLGKLTGKWSIVGDDGTEYMSGDISAVKEVSFAGEWNATSDLPDGSTHETVMHLNGTNTALKGAFDGAAGKTEVDKISVNENGLRLEFDFEMNGNTIDCVIEAEAKGNGKLEGKWIVLGADGSEAAQGEWSAIRKAQSLAGTWKVVASVPDSADYTGTLVLAQKDGKYSGTSAGSDNDAKELDTVKVDGKELVFTRPFERDGNTGTITVEAKQVEDGSLEGEWILTDDGSNELARDSWKATRK